MNAVPTILFLPGGPAQLVSGSLQEGQPRYERDGVPIDVDVFIPADLEQNWFWSGSWLTLRTEPGSCGVSICTATFPPPQCFEQARELDRLGAAWDSVSKKKVKVKGVKRALVAPDVPIVAVPEPELAYEESEPAEQPESAPVGQMTLWDI